MTGAAIAALTLDAPQNVAVIHDLQLSFSPNSKPDAPIVRVHLRSSPAIRICVVGNFVAEDYERLLPEPFEEAEFDLRNSFYKYVRFVVCAADGSKAWSNPFDLSDIKG